jgi:hypothetical protein
VDWPATTPGGNSLEVPIITQLVSPAGDMSQQLSATWQPLQIMFPNFADLTAYSLSGELKPGNTVEVNLLWHVNKQTTDNWTQFIHLVTPTEEISLVDRLPLNGQYPTWAWNTGEKIVDSFQRTLPEGLSAGTYSLKVGFYRQDNGVRMPIVQNGISVSDQSATLVTFKVD